MCHGAEWELLKQAYAREIARRNREKTGAESRKGQPPAPAVIKPGDVAPAKPAEAPARNEEPVPV